MTKSSKLQAYSFFHILKDVNAAAILFAAALLTATIFAVPAFAEELNGENKEITAAGPWNVSYTNSNAEKTSTITIGSLNNGTRYTYSGALTGNIAVDITHHSNVSNDNRFTLSNTGNSFTGGLTMHNGILFVTGANQIPSASNLTLDKTVLMNSAASLTFNNNLTIPSGSFAAFRPSASFTYSGVISGSGDLLITTENDNGVTLSGANTYTGVTSIGTHQGGTTSSGNNKAYLTLGANNTLPSTTVVEIARSQNSTYNYINAAEANLNLNGTTQTIAGLYGAPVATVTSSAASTLTINTPADENYAYDGSISGTVNLIKEGAGTQTFSGNGKSITLASLAVNDGTLAFGPGVNMTVSGKLTLNTSTLDLNGSNLTYTSNVASDFNNVNITNTNTDKQSVLTIAPTDDVSQPTYNKTISGNTRLVVKLKSNQNNNSRFILSGTNTHTGGLYIEQGTVKVDSYSALGSNKVIDMKHSSLMTNKSFDDYTINLVGDASKGERGAIRISGGSTFAAKVTGLGNFEIVYDGAVTLTNTENDYQGKTYIGNFQWRSTNVGDPATLNLGASGVLPDTTEVVFGKNAEGSGTSGAITLDLKGFNETVAGISGQSTNASITSSTPATLTLIGNNDYTFVGKVTGSATVDKKGTGTLTMTGANTGSLVVSEGTLALSGDNTGAQSITVGENGTFIPTGANSAATQINLEGGTLTSYDSTLLNSSTIDVKGNSTINIVGPESGTYSRQLFTGTSKDMSYFTNPEFISNMDLIANTAYSSGAYDANIWGSKTGDQNNTNLLQTNVVNTTDSSITLDFAYQFHNSAYLAITDSEGNRTVVMDWTNTASHTVDGGTYSFATNTGSYTFEPGETYTIEARIFRFNRTIGANGGGLNGFSGTLVGLGARVNGTTGEYLPLNFDGDNWAFSDGSFTFSNQVNFSAPVTINSEASLTFDVPNNDLAVSSAVSGAGTLNVNPAEGFTHTYSGAIADTVVIDKSGEGTMTLSGDCQSIGSVTVEAGTLNVAFDNAATELNIGSIAMAENTAFKVTQGTVAFGQTDVVLNNLSGGSLKDDGTIDVASVITAPDALTLSNDELTKFIGSISAKTIVKTGDGTLQLCTEASKGGISAESFVVSSGRLDMKDYFTGSLEVGENLGNGSYTTAVLSPGNSVGTLTVDGDYTLNPGSTLLIEIGKDDQGNVVADKLIVTGDATFMPGSIINIVLDDASSLAGGETFEGDIIISNNEASLDGVIIRSYYFDINVTQSGNIISLSATLDPNAVPEPSTWALLILGAAGLLYFRKRK